jgi:glutathione synthase/RimK-type ligase-like ATP-grasp enzyme
MVLKQSVERSSRGAGVQLVRYERLVDKLKEVVNERKWQYPILIQEFVRTGPQARTTRVQTFMGRPILTWTSILKDPLPDAGQPDSVIEGTRIATNTPGAAKDRDFAADPEKFAIAARVFEVFSDIPLHGVDILTREDGSHVVLEMNGGGNTWHFSSAGALRIRASFLGRACMLGQLDAWRVIAEELVRRTRAEAV